MLIRRMSPHSLLCLGHYDISFSIYYDESFIISIPDSFSNIFYSKKLGKVQKYVNVKSLTTGNKLLDYH